MMEVKKSLVDFFGDLKNLKVLEVGTGGGSFLEVLVDSFDDRTEIIGIDKMEKYLKNARDEIKSENVKLYEMSADNMEFEDDYFDVVCISNTIHHIENLSTVFDEMKRVLKLNGHMVLNEMKKDNQSEKQNVHVWLHHFSAELDTYLNNYHGVTYNKNEIVDMINNFGFKVEYELEYMEENEDPENEILDDIFENLNKKINRVENKEIQQSYRNRLNKRMDEFYKIGFREATECLFISKLK